MRPRILIALWFALVPALALAQGDGGTQSPFSLGVGSRELSMGGANMALSDPATAPYWNAARLAGAERLAAAALHSRLFESGINYEYAGLVVPTLDHGAFGLGILRHAVSNIDKRDANNLSLGDISLNQFRLYLAYGRALSDFNLGVAVSLEHHSLDQYRATSSPGLNLAVSRAFELPSQMFPEVTVALNGINLLQPGIRVADESYSYPRSLIAAATLRGMPGGNPLHQFLLSASLTKVDQLSPRLRLGLEYSALGKLHVRGGLQDGAPAFGAGVSYQSLAFDYALVDQDLGSIHMVTLNVEFGRPVSERRVRRAQQQERDFNLKMQERMLAQNRQLMEDLVRQGESQLSSGRLEEAVSSLDAALLLARSTDSDVARIGELADRARRELALAERATRYASHIDSATAKLGQGDYLAARYFANLALTDRPQSDSARLLVQRAEDFLHSSAETRTMMEARLATVDTLLAQNRLAEADAVIQSLLEFAPTDNGVQLSAMKVELARWKSALTGSEVERDRALARLDSAQGGQETRTPDSTSPTGTVQETATDTAMALRPATPSLSPEVRKQVQAYYQEAQKQFQAGHLEAAIERWETVERMAPDYLSVRAYLVRAYKYVGVALYARKQRAEAVETWKKAAALAPDDAEIQDYIKHTETEISKLGTLSYGQP